MYSFQDWNLDGKIDGQDRALDYMIYSDTESKGSGGGSGPNRGGCGSSSGGCLLIILLFFAALFSSLSR